ncbi:MAG: ABC transporter permease [Clostridium sp.]|nr:ABC transporter permease [Clostridium sp.]
MIKKKVETVKKYTESKLLHSAKELLGILVALIIICIILTFLSEKFLRITNGITILRTTSINAIVAIGMTFVILTGGIDLSVGSIMSLGGVLCSLMIARTNIGIIPSLLIGLSAGAAVGLINGLCITKLRLVPFIVTLATSYVARGASYLLTNARPVSIKEEFFYEFGNGMIGNMFPYLIIYMLIVFVIFWILLNRTRYGRRIFAIGGNMEAAKFSGIKIDRIIIITYVLSGVLAAFAGIITCAKMYSGQPVIGEDAAMDAIAGVVLGGTSMTGGFGTLTGTIIGCIIIAVINNGMNLIGLNSFWQQVAKGLVILIAVYVDAMKKARKN